MIANGSYGIQICSIALVVLLFYLCLRRKSLGLKSTQVYFTMLLISIICLFLDVGTKWGTTHYDLFNGLAAEVFFRSYMAALVWVAFYGFFYVIHLMSIPITVRKKMQISMSIGVTIATIATYVLPLYEDTSGPVLILGGPAVYSVYFFVATFVTGTIFFTVAHRSQLSQRSLIAITIWIGIWAIVSIMQAVNMTEPITGFAIALGLTVVFAELENPEGFLDRETGVFNAHALLDYMNQFYLENESFSGVDIMLELRERDFNRNQKKAFLSVLGSRLEKIPEAIVFRNVGDEFIVIFKDNEKLMRALPDVKAAIENPISSLPPEITYKPFYLLFPDSRVAGSAEEIFRFHGYFHNTDYDSDTVVIDQTVVDEMSHDLYIRNMISEAIEDGRVEIYYQPIFSIEEGKFTCAEALARIRDKEGNIIMPGVFIPIAEESGMILKLGQIVFESVCRLIRDKDITGLGLSFIEINLSVAQCEQKTLAANFQKIIKTYKVDPRRINLEITESGTLSARKVLINNMNTLIKSGVHFSLDDFGTGQSNLDYIMNMPVQTVKFDRTLTQSYFENERKKFVFQAIARMVKDMGLDIVCEGVETKDQFEEISSLDVDYIQGFYFSRPLPEKEFLYFVKVHNTEAI